MKNRLKIMLIPALAALMLLAGSCNLLSTSTVTQTSTVTAAAATTTITSADGSGSFAIKDIDGDTIAGSLSGVWKKDGNGGKYSGSLTNVTYTPVVDNDFDGHLGSISMLFSSPPLWYGSINEMTMDGAWFKTNVPFDVKGGSTDATVGAAVVPVPGALLLGLIGVMGAAGLRLRKVV